MIVRTDAGLGDRTVPPIETLSVQRVLLPAPNQIELDVVKRKLHLHVSEQELAKRRKAWKAPKPALTRGYWKLYVDHVNQASEGADLDFLVGKSGSDVPRDNH